jgi:aspartate kinase
MGLYVQKYGGSSVADAECMRRVAQRIRDTRAAGNQVVVVVSAMGDTTDDLIALAKQVNPEPNEREMDSLMATGEHGVQRHPDDGATRARRAGDVDDRPAGRHPGGRTSHLKAKIEAIDPQRIRKHLEGLRWSWSRASRARIRRRTSRRWAAADRIRPRWRWRRR